MMVIDERETEKDREIETERAADDGHLERHWTHLRFKNLFLI